MPNDMWSTKIQGILSLDLSRELRFRDDRKDLFLNLLGLREGMTILDIGCGPGAITRKLAKWLSPNTKIIGIDRDSGFIRYAKEKATKMHLQNIDYLEGDPLNIPLDNHSVDACISHTALSMFPTRNFYWNKRECVGHMEESLLCMHV